MNQNAGPVRLRKRIGKCPSYQASLSCKPDAEAQRLKRAVEWYQRVKETEK